MESLIALRKGFLYGLIWPCHFYLQTSFIVTAHSLNMDTLVSEVWAKLDQGERRYFPDKDFIYHSIMALTLDLETRFKDGQMDWLITIGHLQRGPNYHLCSYLYNIIHSMFLCPLSCCLEIHRFVVLEFISLQWARSVVIHRSVRCKPGYFSQNEFLIKYAVSEIT